jgi:hypothetical protein
MYVGPTPVSTGDFDGDSREDLAIGVPREDLSSKVDAGAVHVLYGSAGGLTAERSQFWTQGSPGIPGALEASDGFGWATTAGDFDGDGFDDLAIGAPLESFLIEHDTVVIFGRCCTPDWRAHAGAVNVLYGSPKGLTKTRAQVWHQGKAGIKGKPQNGDFFGAALAAGDFDGDGRDELAVGVPGENKGAGAVQILRGGADGLSRNGDQLWLQDSKDVDDVSEKNDAFGSALAAGNLGYSSKEEDLAIGIPGEDISLSHPFNGLEAGAVAVLYGQPAQGLTATSVPDLYVHQNLGGVEDVVERNDGFGVALAIGDFGRNAREDLAVGVPGEDARSGAVQVFYGSSFGIDLQDDQLWKKAGVSDATQTLKGDAQPGEELGRSLSAADFNGFSQNDLAIGSPFADVAGTHDAGSVNVVYGGPSGLTVTGSVAVPEQVLSLGTPWSDRFGFALAAGRFGGDSAVRLVVSAPEAEFTRGRVHVINLDTPGPPNHQVWHQGTTGIADNGEAGDRFGGG